MTKEELKSKIESDETRIHDEIRKIYPNSAGLDGIIKIDDFLDLKKPDSNPLRILWVLKERGYPRNKKNQEFYIKDYMLYLAQYEKWKLTYGNICSVTEGILEWQRMRDDKYLSYRNLPELNVEQASGSVYYMTQESSPQQIFPIDYVAFLNVKKLGSNENTSNQGVINEEYSKPEIQNILREQFAYINPDITIFGNQVEKMAEDFGGVSLSDFKVCGKCKYHFDSSSVKLYIYAHHPNVHGHMTNEEYCNSIFDVIKIHKKELLIIGKKR